MYNLSRTIRLSALAICMLTANSSCKKPSENVDLIVDTQFTKATVAIRFVDVKTGIPVGFENDAEKVTVTIEGPDKDLIVDNSGRTKFHVGKGHLTLCVKEGYVPSSSDPIKFNVVAHAPGYLSTSAQVIISEEGNTMQDVQLVDLNNTPNGVAAIQDNSATANQYGNMTADYNLETPLPVTNHEKTTAKIHIPAGTKLTNEKGNPVTGTISATMVYFNNLDDASLMSFPGGFAATTENEGDIIFKTAGFVALELKNQNGSEVKHFSNPIQMTVEIPAVTTNEAGAAITDGMVIPIWSYEPSTGAWTKEQDATISWNSNTGKYESTFNLNHLSYWNLDWYNNACSSGATLNFTSNANGSRSVMVEMRRSDGTLFMQNYVQVNSGTTSLQFLNAPQNIPLTLTFYNLNSCAWPYSTSEVLGVIQISNLCSGTYTVNLNFPTSVVQNTQTTTLDFSIRCSNNPNQVIRPQLSIYAYNLSTCTWNREYIGQMVNGQISTNVLIPGNQYMFFAVFNGNWYSDYNSYTINQTNYVHEVTLGPNDCSLLN